MLKEFPPPSPRITDFILPENNKVLAFFDATKRRHVVVVNLSRFAQAAELDLSARRRALGGLQQMIPAIRSRLRNHARPHSYCCPPLERRLSRLKTQNSDAEFVPSVRRSRNGRGRIEPRYAALNSQLPMVGAKARRPAICACREIRSPKRDWSQIGRRDRISTAH